MINVYELDKRINNATKVIDDVILKTKNIEEEILRAKELAFDNAHADLITYRKLIIKAMGELHKNIRICFDETLYGNGAIDINSSNIRLESNDMLYNLDCDHVQGFKNLNRCHPAVEWFEYLSLHWDDVIDDIEKQVIEGINFFLKERANIAHEEYNKTKKTAEEYGVKI